VSERTRVCSVALTPSHSAGPPPFAATPANQTVSSIPLAMMRRETHVRSMNVPPPFLSSMRKVRFLNINTPLCSEPFLTVTDSLSFRNGMFRNNTLGALITPGIAF
jgi:hypothetical protein